MTIRALLQAQCDVCEVLDSGWLVPFSHPVTMDVQYQETAYENLLMCRGWEVSALKTICRACSIRLGAEEHALEHHAEHVHVDP